MPKRKHEEISSSETLSNGTEAKALRLQQLQISGLLDQSKTHLFRSLKVARGFERQKLGRRQKTAKAVSNAADTKARLDAEVAALKGLDLDATAEIHLYKSLLKIKSIALAPALPHHVRATVDALKMPHGSASVNVQARLFKSAPVQAAMTEALKGIRAVLGIEELKHNGKGRLRAKDYANGSPNTDVDGLAVSRRDGSPVVNTQARDEEDWSGFSAYESLGNDQTKAADDDDDDDDGEDMNYDMYAIRLAGSSDEESNGVDVKGQDHDRDKLHDMEITEDGADEEDVYNNEEAEDHTKSNIASTNPTPKRAPQPSKSKPPSGPPKSTTFLPSLSLGGYWSGSDSDVPSDDDIDSTAADTQIRKNRMGQQARRALWEKKFGTNANHVRKQQVRDRDQGWDARKGAQGVDERGKRGRGRGKGGGGRGMMGAGRGGSRGGRVRFAKSTGANSDPVVARKAKTSAAAAATAAAAGPLHPSWEAARKAKEQKKAVPQGKKVVFD